MTGRGAPVILSDSTDGDPDEQDQSAITIESSDSQQESDSSDDSDDNEDNSSDGSNPGALLDLEAADSGSEAQDSEESFDEDAYEISGQGFFQGRDRRNFPQFMKLPVELRLRIWETYCPDLNSSRRVLEINISCSAESARSWFPTEGMTLSTMTKPSRTVLAVHKESRELALTWFPDTLPICDPAGELRFNRTRDIVLIKPAYPFTFSQRNPLSIEGWRADFCAKIINIAVPADPIYDSNANEALDPDDNHNTAPRVPRFGFHLRLLQSFSNVQNVYGVINMDDLSRKHFTWLETDHCHWTKVRGNDATTYYCWHDPNTPCNREDACAPHERARFCELLKPEDDIDDHNNQNWHLSTTWSPVALPSTRPIHKWPMVQIDEPIARSTIEKTRPFKPDTSGLRVPRNSVWDWSEGFSEGSPSENEYESDGIDDVPIDDPQTEDDEVGSGIEDDTLAMELLSRNRTLDSNDSDEDGLDSDSDVEELGFRGFSPLDQGSESEAPAPKSPSKRMNARRIVLDDSDEEENEAEENGGDDVAASSAQTAAAGARGVKRRRIISDDENEEDEDDARPQKRHHGEGADPARKPSIVSIDSSDSEPAASSRPARRAGIIEDDSSEEDEDEDEEDEDDEPPKTISLAERLQMHRKANPVSSASEDNSGSDDDEEDSGLRYGEGESESEEENSILDDMAEDGTEEEEDDEDDY
ncbi:hypothetical protein B0T11DRAFT_282264 [Plectosphaerella cucumerina]|uniref:2EXR domain-containing protein n=1 Tax=Plectosphaerella cucumerina TaxID=40658 RepID=A0A8K0TID8_9PEZI|nr:hypothetical protein B0T11DRAFT_282264 [Plectosphaerella cucumerina]